MFHLIGMTCIVKTFIYVNIIDAMHRRMPLFFNGFIILICFEINDDSRSGGCQLGASAENICSVETTYVY